MAPRQRQQQQKKRRANCQICEEVESKYACPGCEVLYCSVACYKQHKGSSCSASSNATGAADNGDAIETPAQVESLLHDDGGLKSASNRLESVPRLLASEDGDAPSFVSASQGSTAQLRQGEDLNLLGRLDVGNSHAETNMDEDVEAEHAPTELSGKAGNVEKQEAGYRAEIDKGAATPVTSIAPETSSSSGSTKPNSSHNHPHPASSQSQPQPNENSSSNLDSDSESISKFYSNRPLRKLSSLKWPYIPDVSSYPDPLERDDPKPLSLAQYEAIARSPTIRRALSTHPSLPSLLQKLDSLRGPARERALERVLGVAPSQTSFSLSLPANSSSHYSMPTYPTSSVATTNRREGEVEVGIETNEEDMHALRDLAQAVEAAIRSVPTAIRDFESPNTGTSNLLGLDWENTLT